MILIEPGVNQNRIAGFDSGPAGGNGISAAAVVVISTHDRVKSRLGFWAFIIRMIDVIHLALRVGFRFGAGPYARRP